MSNSYNNTASYHVGQGSIGSADRETIKPSPNCQKSPVGAAIAGKQHLLDELEKRRQWYSNQVTQSYADAQRHSETIHRLTTAINILTLNPNFAEFCELLGLKVP